MSFVNNHSDISFHILEVRNSKISNFVKLDFFKHFSLINKLNIFTMCSNLSHPSLLPYTPSPRPPITYSFHMSSFCTYLLIIVFVCIHWAHLALPIYAWVWGHLLGQREPTSDYILRKVTLPKRLSTANSFLARHVDSGVPSPSMLEFWAGLILCRPCVGVYICTYITLHTYLQSCIHTNMNSVSLIVIQDSWQWIFSILVAKNLLISFF